MAEQDKQNIAAPMIMNLDAAPDALEQGEFSFVLNGVPELDTAGRPFTSNIGATEFAGVAFPKGFDPIGRESIDGKSKLVFLVNMASDLSEIGIVEATEYRTVAQSPDLGFHIDAHISCRIKRIFDGTYIAYWTDFRKPMRCMNIQRPPYVNVIDPGTGLPTPTTTLDIDQLNVFKNYIIPQMVVSDVFNNGTLKTGGYFMTAQYADSRGNGLTQWFRLTGKIPVFRDSVNDPYDMITGNQSGVPTNKALKLHFEEVDISFTHLNIGAIRIIDGSITSFKIATVPVTQSDYTYTGAGIEIPVLLEDMVADPTVYETAKAVEESDGSLVWVNLKGKKQINLQTYVNQVQVQWQAYKAKGQNRKLSAKNPLFAAYNQSYRRDEVVPLALVFEFLDGTESMPHPIIGRAANKKSNGEPFTETKDVYGHIVNPDLWDTEEIRISNDDVYEREPMPRYKVYNTATIEGNKLPAGQEEGLAFFGEMAFWESTDRYPLDAKVWGAMAGQPIRHPKFPDSAILHIHDGQDGKRGFGDDVFIYHMGIILPNIDEVMNSIPDEFRKTIRSWRLVRADRTFEKSVVASGMLFNCLWQDFNQTEGNEPDIRMYPNYGLNDLRPDPYIRYQDWNRHNPNFYRDRFTFLSPDTTMEKASLNGTELRINAELYGKADCFHDWVSPYPLLKQKDGHADQAAIQAVAIGHYNNYHRPRSQHTRRPLEENMYIPFGVQTNAGNAGKVMWNKGRESSVLLKTGGMRPLRLPSEQDRTRFILTNDDRPPFEECFGANQDDALQGIQAHVKRPCSAFYGTIKRVIPNQYGTIHSVRYVDTGYTEKRYKKEGIIFGGDTTIAPFSAKRVHPFYNDIQDWMDNDAEGDGINFRATENIRNTYYYYKNQGGKNPRNNSVMMNEDNSGHSNISLLGGLVGFLISSSGDDKDLGFLTLFMAGVPYFWVESDINHALRYEGQTVADAFYPTLMNGALNVQEWLGVEQLDKDNTFLHNQDLSGFNNLKTYLYDDSTLDPDNDAIRHYHTRAIKSLRSQPEDINDNWQAYKPLDYYDFPKSRGSIVDVRYIGGNKTLFRMERGLYMTRLLHTISTSGEDAILGSGRLFEQEPEELVYSQGAYAGTGEQWAFDICEFGAFMVNSARGKVFNIAQGIQPISDVKAAAWFEQNLPLLLPNEVKDMPTDSPFNPEGIGFHSVYDSRHKLWFLTKKDYELVDKALIGRLKYENGYVFLDGGKISLRDPRYFINRSFTIAYSPVEKGWKSFYSFIPDFYIADDIGFRSTSREADLVKLHNHGVKGKYNNFYGRRHPFIVEYATRVDGIGTYVNTHSTFITKSFILRGRDLIAVQGRSFNKAIVYNNLQCTGLLNLIVQDENKLSSLYSLKVHADSKDTALRSRDGHWNFSDYFDIVKGEDAIFTEEWLALQDQFFMDKVLNKSNLDYKRFLSVGAMIRGQFAKTRLILDNADDLKLLFQVGIDGVRASYT